MEISGNDLACERGGRLVFEALGFRATGGRMLVLRGPNGAGKTSLLRLIAGLAEPAGGSIAVSGLTDPDLSGQVHFIAHQDAIKMHLSVEENLVFWSRFLGGSTTAAHVERALDAMNLRDLRSFQPQRLSGGHKRRLGLARLALVHRPVWLLDEPTVGLDTRSQALLANLMTTHLDAGNIIIASTHIDLPVASTDVLEFASAAA